MHLPNRVQTLGISLFGAVASGGYEMDALVSISLKLGNFLKPTIGLVLNVCAQSLLCSIIFQFLVMNFLTSGLLINYFFLLGYFIGVSRSQSGASRVQGFFNFL